MANSLRLTVFTFNRASKKRVRIVFIPYRDTRQVWEKGPGDPLSAVEGDEGKQISE